MSKTMQCPVCNADHRDIEADEIGTRIKCECGTRLEVGRDRLKRTETELERFRRNFPFLDFFISPALLLAAGSVLIAIGAFMNTTVEAHGEKIHNIGLMNTRIVIVMIGGIAFISGAIFSASTRPPK